MSNDKLMEFLKNFQVNTICSICKHSGFFLYADELVPKQLSCMRDEAKTKFCCSDHSGFEMKPKRSWYKFRIANLRTGKWEFYRTATYNKGEFFDIEVTKVGMFD